MDAASQIMKTIDELRKDATDIFQSRKTISEHPSQFHAAWHMNEVALFNVRPFPHITRLYLQDCKQLTSLYLLQSFPNLETLWIYGSDKLSHIDGIQSSKALKSLTIWASFSATITLDSLAALSGITDLEHIVFSGKTRDGSLSHLDQHQNLKTAFFSNSYSWQEIAGFEARHPAISFPWKGGVVYEADPQVLKCKKCGTPQAMLAGKGLKLACPLCDLVYLKKHIARYSTIAMG
ncbi:MAG: leucine-rich repeat domain-containing protein [Sulfitobacter sp.]